MATINAIFPHCQDAIACLLASSIRLEIAHEIAKVDLELNHLHHHHSQDLNSMNEKQNDAL